MISPAQKATQKSLSAQPVTPAPQKTLIARWETINGKLICNWVLV